MLTLRLHGRVVDAEDEAGLGGLHVAVRDMEGKLEKILEPVVTDVAGRFEIPIEREGLDRLLEGRPLFAADVYAPDGVTLIHSIDRIGGWERWTPKDLLIRIPAERAAKHRPATKMRMVGDDGDEQDVFEIGDSLSIEVSGLAPGQTYDIGVGQKGKALMISRIIADAQGVIEPVTLWPQIGLDEIQGDRVRSVEEAVEAWGRRSLALEVRRGQRVLAERTFSISDRFSRPLVLSTDEDGRLRGAIEAGKADVIVSGFNVRSKELVRVFMVPRQQSWAPGDRFDPVTLVSGRPAIVDTEVESGRFRVRLARGRELAPGSYDFIVRELRYGYEDDDELFLRPTDLIGCRDLTGLVVRMDFMDSKAVLGSCVNYLQIAGRTIAGAPYFQYTDTFQLGESIYAALDPAALDPNHQAKMVALYVVDHKSAAGWSADKSLQHLAVLGGNPAVQVFKTQPSCVNYNKRLVWPNASIVGEYDVIADFGNNSPDAATFSADDNFDTPLDIIDGYFLAGFRVVPDPTVDTSFAHAGSFSYDQTTEGSVTVSGDYGSTWTVPRRAIVYFPADAAGATSPAQISSAQPDYPLVVVVHGNANSTSSYLGYNYLLEHLAKNGFIAASIHLQPGQWATDRARVLFSHLDLLKAKFGVKIQNNIGLMGHSRGGEAIVVAARLNNTEALGHQFNALISLAPTDFIVDEIFAGPWAAPYLVIYGALDGDVAGGPPLPMATGFALFDRADGMEKSMVFCYGAIHDRFNTVWGDADLYFGQIGPTDLPNVATADAHEKTAKGYMTGFFRQHLQGENKWEGIFRGEWVPAAVAAADPGKLRPFVQYIDTTKKVVDDFEGAHTPTSWQTGPLGNVDDDGTLPLDPSEDDLYDVDNHSPHDTSGLLLRWDGLGDRLRFDVPAAHKDVSAYAALAFRVTQKVNSPSNPMTPQDLYMTLRDTGGKSRSIKVAKFAEIPVPQKRHYDQFTKSAMNTIRIPLHAFTIECAGMDRVDLQNIASVTFDFKALANGEIEIDSVEFTN